MPNTLELLTQRNTKLRKWDKVGTFEDYSTVQIKFNNDYNPKTNHNYSYDSCLVTHTHKSALLFSPITSIGYLKNTQLMQCSNI